MQELSLQYALLPTLHPLGSLTRLRSLELHCLKDGLNLRHLSTLSRLTHLFMLWEDCFPDDLDLGSLAALTALHELHVTTSGPQVRSGKAQYDPQADSTMCM